MVNIRTVKRRVLFRSSEVDLEDYSLTVSPLPSLAHTDTFDNTNVSHHVLTRAYFTSSPRRSRLSVQGPPLFLGIREQKLDKSIVGVGGSTMPGSKLPLSKAYRHRAACAVRFSSEPVMAVSLESYGPARLSVSMASKGAPPQKQETRNKCSANRPDPLCFSFVSRQPPPYRCFIENILNAKSRACTLAVRERA